MPLVPTWEAYAGNLRRRSSNEVGNEPRKVRPGRERISPLFKIGCSNPFHISSPPQVSGQLPLCLRNDCLARIGLFDPIQHPEVFVISCLRCHESLPHGEGHLKIEIDAALLTVTLLRSTSGTERAFRIVLCPQSVLISY